MFGMEPRSGVSSRFPGGQGTDVRKSKAVCQHSARMPVKIAVSELVISHQV
jgi:hypothetical protein